MENWTPHILYDLAEWINGMAFRDINFSSKGRPVIKIAEIKNGLSGQTKFTDVEYDEKYLVTKGDMLFCWSGQPETSIGTYYWQETDGWLNQHIFKVLPKTDIVDREFFYHLLQGVNPRFIQIARNKQTTGLGHVTKKDLQNLEVHIPPPNEQKAIAKVLSSLDDKIELNRRMSATLEAMARALFKAWFVDFEPVHANMECRPSTSASVKIAKLFPSEFENGIPKGWQFRKLGDTLVIAYGKNLPTTQLKDSGFPVFGGNGIIGYHDRYLYDRPQVLVACRGAASGKINQSLPRSFVTNNSLILQTDEETQLRFNYLKHFMLNVDATAFVTGSAQPQVTIENIQHLQTLAPNEDVLERFEAFGNSLEELILRNQEQNTLLAGIRDSLLPRLISGKIKVGVQSYAAKD